MLDQKVRLISEGLAKSVGRRTFLKQTGNTVFAGMAALAAGHLLGGKASARTQPTYNPPQCAPPGPYCNLNGVNDPNGCRGGSCYQHRYNGNILQCRVYYQYYQAGCWTTSSQGGYWTCCDCECGNPRQMTCGCAQFSANPVPRPDNPVAPAGV